MKKVPEGILKRIVYRITPVKKDRVLFSSYHGHFSDNPKAIYEYCKVHYPQFEYVWLINPSLVGNIPSGLKYINIDNSIAKAKIEGSAKVHIGNFYGNSITLYENERFHKLKKIAFYLFNCKSNQQFYTTFHGTPYKQIGRDRLNNDVAEFISFNTEMILGNQFSVDLFNHISDNTIKTSLIGCPRNDILFKQDVRDDLCKKLKLDSNYRYLLYAPTFRSNEQFYRSDEVNKSGVEQLGTFDFDSLFNTLKNKLGGEWRIICRFHQHVQKQIDWVLLNSKFDNSIINGNDSDEMAEYLCVADALLTDYSSAMFDYALTKKPCFLYVPDLSNYVNNERGLYIPIEELPFPFAETFEELLSTIRSFDICSYTEQVSALLQRMGYVDSEYSTEKVSEYIVQKSLLGSV